MIDEIKQLLDLVKELPDLAIWSLAGFGIYKLIVYLSTTGSIVFIFKLLIEKIHNAYTSPRQEKPRDVKIDGYFLTSDGTYHDFIAVLRYFLNAKNKPKPETGKTLSFRAFTSEYIHKSDVTWLEAAIKEKLAREEKESA